MYHLIDGWGTDRAMGAFGYTKADADGIQNAHLRASGSTPRLYHSVIPMDQDGAPLQIDANGNAIFVFYLFHARQHPLYKK